MGGKEPVDTEETNKTAGSTFKPKSLRNRANHEKLLKEQSANEEESKENRQDRRKAFVEMGVGELFKARLVTFEFGGPG